MKRVHLLPNLLTLANAFCGLLALAKGIDALAYSGDDPLLFYRKMETACQLIFAGMVFDVLDGFAARITRSESAFGAQLDSFADALTFGVCPALLAKILIEHEEALHGSFGTSRVHFLAAAAFALMAILRLVRFNLDDASAKVVPGVELEPALEDDDDAPFESEMPEEERQKAPRHRRKDDFSGLPSPAAAGTVASTIWLYLILVKPDLERSEGTPTPTHQLMELFGYDPATMGTMLEWLPRLALMGLPILGLLMVSHVRYPHLANVASFGRRPFFQLVAVVFAALLLNLLPALMLFVIFNGFVLIGIVGAAVRSRRHLGRGATS